MSVEELTEALLALSPKDQDRVTDLLLMSEKDWGTYSTMRDMRKEERRAMFRMLKSQCHSTTALCIYEEWLDASEPEIIGGSLVAPWRRR